MSDASIKVISLLDELEELISNASRVPFSDKAVVDSEEIDQMIADIRTNMPKDLQQARWINTEQDRIMAEAKAEYDKIIVSAKKQAEFLVEDAAIKREASKRADALTAESENRNRFLKLKTYEYIDEQLFNLQTEIQKIVGEFLQPMNEKVMKMLSEMNEEVNANRQEMSRLSNGIKDDAEKEQ